MSFWSWAVLALVAWLLVALVVGRLLGAMVKRRDAQHVVTDRPSDRRAPPGSRDHPEP